MPSATVVLCALLGAIVGALVPRTAYRLSVAGGTPNRSACAACDTAFASGVAGWLRFTRRCSGCGALLGPRSWLTVTVGVLSFGALGWAFGPAPVLVPLLGVAAAGVLLTFVDLACLRLPNPVVGVALLAVVVPLAVLAAVAGEPGRFGRAVLAGLACAGGYLVLALLPGANLGLGDVKLAGVLGLLLGWLGWPAVVLGIVLPHLINGPIALVLLLTRRADRRTHLPLGPALLAGALLAALLVARLPGS